MAKDDPGGLLSKVVRFVRNPATNWSDLDEPESVGDSGNSRQMLKELVERKKRNDFVRKREFEMLRKLRRREMAGSQASAPRPSFFQSSLPSKPDERAQTLKKIDEIEAQMSMQWWKTKHRDTSINSSMFPTSGPSPLAPPAPPAAPLRPLLEPMPSLDGQQVPAAPPAPKGAGPVAAGRAAKPPAPAPKPAVAAASTPAPDNALRFETTGSGFSNSKSAAIEVGENAHDPELDEAAIRFANGDDQGAEAGLLDRLGNGDDPSTSVEKWLTLFDLYRATGQQERFDIAAIDFANQFQRSAPQWFSMPFMVSELAAAQPTPVQMLAAHWSCPPLLNAKSVGVLVDIIGRTLPPWRLDWTRLTTIEPAALTGLTRLFQAWAQQPVELRLTAVDHLDQVLAACTPSGDRSVAADWWHARMALLRVLRRMDEFEMAALNYCVTYEVSPPSWEDPRCICRIVSGAGQDKDAGASTIISSLDSVGAEAGDKGSNDFRMTTFDSVMLPPVTVELSGSIAGDVSATLERLDRKFQGADVLSISCAKLVRVDFAAAGTLLNWVSSHCAQGRQVQFIDVHRLIGAFFNVIGISELARISVRTD
jgi:ABC-type transporter Mla MlaB component